MGDSLLVFHLEAEKVWTKMKLHNYLRLWSLRRMEVLLATTLHTGGEELMVVSKIIFRIIII